MSFSGNAKEELSEKIPQSRHCRLAELAAMIAMCGTSFSTDTGENRIKFHTENLLVARKCFTLLKKTFNIEANISVRNHSAGRNTSYRIEISDHDAVKTLLGVQSLLGKQCCRRAFLRGAFLTAGSMSDPRKAYHFELVCADEKTAEQLQRIMCGFSVDAKIVRRKKMYVVYLKEGEQIVDMLNIMEAYVSLMELENIRILKEMRNSVNRKVNCETANIHKTVSAAVRQVEDIHYIQQTQGLDRLPENLREMAKVRLEHPDTPLKELGEFLNPPVGKSGVNHRLRKITEIADHLRVNKEELS